MNITKIINTRRTIRRFIDKPIDKEILVNLVDLARMAPSGSNMQPLKYVIINDTKLVKEVFAFTRWAGYLQGKGSPTKEQAPTAFIIVLNDQTIRKSGYELDAGASIQNILLGATDLKIGTAWLGAIDRDQIRKLLTLPKKYTIISAIALGIADYKTIVEDEQGDIKYYVDDLNTLHIPKRKLNDIIVLTK